MRVLCRPRTHKAKDVAFSRFNSSWSFICYLNSTMAEAAQIKSHLNEARILHCFFEYTRHPPSACPSRSARKADKFPSCYIITMAVIFTLVGSGATAILSSVYWNGSAGGLAIGQYILRPKKIAIKCVLQIHGKTYASWTK